MQKKGVNFSCSQERFLELCKSDETGTYNSKQWREAVGVLPLEFNNFVENVRRLDNPDVKLDFRCEKNGRPLWLDHKQAVALEILEKQGVQTSGFPNHQKIFESIGRKAVSQKYRYLKQPGGPTRPTEVLHIIDLAGMNRLEKPLLTEAVLKGAKTEGWVDTSGFLFINNE